VHDRCQREAIARQPAFGYVYGVTKGSQEFYERFAALYRCIRGLGEQAYADIEVGTAQAKFLRHIGTNSQISQAELARITQTAPTLTGRVLDAMVEHGWVRRERSTQDRREYTLELTASGKRIRDRVVQARDNMIRRLSRVLDERDVEDFDRIADKILTAFGQ
jgi:DNA-binding MarR family transcriptional regulator